MYHIVRRSIPFGEFMKTEMLSARIDHDIKLALTNVCGDMGLSTFQAI